LQIIQEIGYSTVNRACILHFDGTIDALAEWIFAPTDQSGAEVVQEVIRDINEFLDLYYVAVQLDIEVLMNSAVDALINTCTETAPDFELVAPILDPRNELEYDKSMLKIDDEFNRLKDVMYAALAKHWLLGPDRVPFDELAWEFVKDSGLEKEIMEAANQGADLKDKCKFHVHKNTKKCDPA